MMSVPEVLKWKLNLQRTEIVYVVVEELDILRVGS